MCGIVSIFNIQKQTPFLRIANPQSLNRLGHFLTPDFKSGGTPGGFAHLSYFSLFVLF